MGKVMTGSNKLPTRAQSTSSSPPVPSETGQVQVVLRLTIDRGEEVKKRTLQVLEELRQNGRVMNGCLHFEIFVGQEDDICILQTWANHEALDDYHNSSFFNNSKGKFAGLLTDQPEFTVYTHHPAA